MKYLVLCALAALGFAGATCPLGYVQNWEGLCKDCDY